MVGIAMERYLVIVFPVWYRCRRTMKTTVVICVMAWALSALHPIAQCFSFIEIKTIDIVFLLFPLPPLIFFLVGTLKALSASISVQADEKRRIVGTLVLVLLIYMLLFLPNTILTVLNKLKVDTSHILVSLSHVFVRLSPLADLVLYIFMKKGAVDKLLASVCCCRMESNDVISVSV
ncbi:LOW QUALITY PROTEIN: mas-related G-protein coupled receptor member X4-like [Sander lucioperca]|uniref:LOW QUALITY PROTEIN: mas-related G-protein coupled receptor member X4-like n=1 Tax=Sander lucioperca TaxID=283035 RepID=UPI001653854B|nr:LOW QUALITY PROTEIN: mas-related G-protein coupled receptor member X4-like [Sander lucioperca]